MTSLTSFVLGIFLAASIILALLVELSYHFKKNPVQKLCEGPHKWMTVNLIGSENSQEKQLCTDCGFVSGSDTIVPKADIDLMLDVAETLNEQQLLFDEFLEKEYEDIRGYFKKELDNGLDFDNLINLHSAGADFKERFAIYSFNKGKK